MALENCGLQPPEPERLEAAVQRCLAAVPHNPAGPGFLLTDESDLILVYKG